VKRKIVNRISQIVEIRMIILSLVLNCSMKQRVFQIDHCSNGHVLYYELIISNCNERLTKVNSCCYLHQNDYSNKNQSATSLCNAVSISRNGKNLAKNFFLKKKKRGSPSLQMHHFSSFQSNKHMSDSLPKVSMARSSQVSC
jgi:hypothetical protein